MSFSVTPFANIHHFLIYALHFQFNASWVAALYYAKPCLFHFFLWEYNFLCLLFREQNYRKKRASHMTHILTLQLLLFNKKSTIFCKHQQNLFSNLYFHQICPYILWNLYVIECCNNWIRPVVRTSLQKARALVLYVS